jgi:hypothetical protein
MRYRSGTWAAGLVVTIGCTSCGPDTDTASQVFVVTNAEELRRGPVKLVFECIEFGGESCWGTCVRVESECFSERSVEVVDDNTGRYRAEVVFQSHGYCDLRFVFELPSGPPEVYTVPVCVNP